MGGGPVRNINLLVWGVDMVEEQLLLSAGIPSRPPTAPAPLMCLAEYSMNAPVSGIVEHTNYLDEWKEHPQVLYARPLVEKGGKVCWVLLVVCCVVFCGEVYAEARGKKC